LTDAKNLVHELNLFPILPAQLELRIRLVLEFRNFFTVISELHKTVKALEIKLVMYASEV
jgi:hypothetical protein